MTKKVVVFFAVVLLMAALVWYAVSCLPRAGSAPEAVAPAVQPLPALGPVCGVRCGTRRWTVKTLSDPDRECVSLNAVDATIEKLASLQPPAHRPDAARIRPVECTVYRVEAYLAGWESVVDENDGDLHVFLFGKVDQRVSLIGEIPNPECAGACRSGMNERYALARANLLEGLQRNNPKDRNVVVRVTGVGFFDQPHHQNYAAPNNFELHPVLSIEFLPLDSAGMAGPRPPR